jgi:TPR repeat protein
MYLRWLQVTVLLSSMAACAVQPAAAQSSEEQPTPAIVESPPPVTPPSDDSRRPEPVREDAQDAVTAVGELRAALKTSPDDADTRVRLAQALYRLGEFDAAVEQCRIAIKLNQDDANAHLQLGVLLMAKQEWRAAVSVLKEAVRLDPGQTHAYYTLGSAQYSSGNITAAIESYRQALELQPSFPDARYRLALLLKLTKQEQESTRFMEEAAVGGVPQARFFLGNAYKTGAGVEKNLRLAIFWWMKAGELGHQPAFESLSKLRRQALSADHSERRSKDTLEAFRAYRLKLWDDFPEYNRSDADEGLGSRLLQENRADQALGTLLAEAYAMSEPAQDELARLYESGREPGIAPHDKRILACLEATAADGFLPARKHMARIYAKGLGVAADPQKAKSMLRDLPKQESKSLLDALDLQP